jgi:hypothetical protein
LIQPVVLKAMPPRYFRRRRGHPGLILIGKLGGDGHDGLTVMWPDRRTPGYHAQEPENQDDAPQHVIDVLRGRLHLPPFGKPADDHIEDRGQK